MQGGRVGWGRGAAGGHGGDACLAHVALTSAPKPAREARRSTALLPLGGCRCLLQQDFTRCGAGHGCRGRRAARRAHRDAPRVELLVLHLREAVLLQQAVAGVLELGDGHGAAGAGAGGQAWSGRPCVVARSGRLRVIAQPGRLRVVLCACEHQQEQGASQGGRRRQNAPSQQVEKGCWVRRRTCPAASPCAATRGGCPATTPAGRCRWQGCCPAASLQQR